MSRLAALVGCLAIVSLAPVASADVVPPGEAACQASSAGAACRVDGAAGVCAASRCSRLDYAGWDRDASATPPTVEYDCLVCEPGAAPDAGDDGCSVSAVGAAAPSGSVLVVLGALAVLSARRRGARPA